VIIEPGSARALFANRAVHAAAGGELPLGDGALPVARVAGDAPLQNVQVDWSSPRGPRSVLVSTDTIELPGTGPVEVMTFEDVTELEASRRRSALLDEAGEALAAALDAGTVLETIADLVVPRFADWCFVELAEEDGSIDRAVIRAAEPALQALVYEYAERYPLDPDSPVGSPKVIRTGEADRQGRSPTRC
jgi:hypothetical protein